MKLINIDDKDISVASIAKVRENPNNADEEKKEENEQLTLELPEGN